MPYFVYILKTGTNTLYTGIAKNPETRLAEHQDKSGKGAKYTRAFGATEIVYTEQFPTRSEALKREYQIKKMSRKQKVRLIKEMSIAFEIGST